MSTEPTAVPSLADLVRGVELLSLDAGNTVIFLDHARLADLYTSWGFPRSREDFIAAEGRAKRRHLTGDMLRVSFPRAHLPGAAGWGAMQATMAFEAGVPEAALAALVDRSWDEHVRLNFWSLVPQGFVAAMERLRAVGVRVALVSNSEGMLDPLFRELGIRDVFDIFLDSGVVGIEKPDRRIFDLAREPFATAPETVLHLGDMISTDVEGAHGAGLRAALIDPFGHYAGLFPDVPRVAGVVAAADAIVRARSERLSP